MQKCLPPTVVISTYLDFMFHWLVSETETSKHSELELYEDLVWPQPNIEI